MIPVCKGARPHNKQGSCREHQNGWQAARSEPVSAPRKVSRRSPYFSARAMAAS